MVEGFMKLVLGAATVADSVERLELGDGEEGKSLVSLV